MIGELRVRDLGVIAEVDLVLDGGLTAITGETGAGKTLIVDALGLLLGGRSDPTMVRAGATETTVEGRFFDGADERVLARSVPSSGRSRAMIDGALATQASLDALGHALVDLYGQHAHQSLLSPAEQRRALDRYAGVDLGPLTARYEQRAHLDAELAALGGDDRARARELDLVRFELEEIDQLRLRSASEDDELQAEEFLLGEAQALREAVLAAHAAIAGPAGASELVSGAVSPLSRLAPLEAFEKRARALAAELDDLATELRRASERFEDDPIRLAQVLERRAEIARVVRKHGESVSELLAAREQLAAHRARLESTDLAREGIGEKLRALESEIAAEQERIGDLRRRAAPSLGRKVGAHLSELGLSGARFAVELPATGFAEQVVFALSTNQGEPLAPLAKVASGGELARAMLALRLVLSAGPPTLIFDEVDAGLGGAAALAVGRALASLGREHQVLVVTHLAQVAAFADHQLVVDKIVRNGRTLSTVREVQGEDRLAELARMLSGHPDSKAARIHARELLERASASLGRS